MDPALASYDSFLLGNFWVNLYEAVEEKGVSVVLGNPL